jgi:hypothetical protein
MSDNYEKQTVANLRALLKERAIPSTGLTRKAQIIAKLRELDAEAVVQPDEPPTQETNDATAETPIPDSPVEQLSKPATEEANLSEEPKAQVDQQVTEDVPVEPKPSAKEAAPESLRRDESEPIQAISTTEAVVEEPTVSATQQSAAPSAVDTDPESSKKRKRRSATPPINTQELAIKKKKYLMDRVHLKEDIGSSSMNEQTEVAKTKDDRVDRKDHAELSPKSADESKQQAEKKRKVGDSPSHDPSEKRQSIPDAAPSQEDFPTPPPALHPATCALYIRNFMRPLQPNTLRQHLLSLANDPESIEVLHVDSIRSHAFILFSSQSAAARARSGMHDQVWPKERDRKPLWADYIPEEKIKEWIDVETNADNGPRSGTKRWEVVYEEHNGELTAYLSEQGSQRRVAATVKAEPTSTNVAPPVREKMETAIPSGSKAAPASESFVALDKLFQSTKAKPMLYYMPAKQEIAERRLNTLNQATKRDWSSRDWREHDELRRYTFEDGKFVDSGPHVFGARARQRQQDRFRGIRSPQDRGQRYGYRRG